MRTLTIASLVVGSALIPPRVASADEGLLFVLGAQVQYLTAGSVTIGDDTVDAIDTAAVAVTVEHEPSPYIRFGFAPRLVFVSGRVGDDVDRGGQIDLMGRLTGRLPLGAVTPFAYLTAGYSLLATPDAPDDIADPEGAALGFGGGAAVRVSTEIEVLVDIGYQHGFQRQADDTYAISDLHVGVGVQTRL